MHRKPIGTTGLEVAEIVFGASALGDMPDTYGYDVSEERARATIRRIFEGPANMIDTARIYGFGESERRIGAAIAEAGGLPEGMMISSKLDRDVETGRFDAAQARRSLEQSLEALGLDHIHLLHLHDPEHARDLDEIAGKGGALDELVKMKEEGLVSAIGLAMGRIPLMRDLLFRWPFDALITHNRFTLLNREADEMYDAAAEAGIAILNAAPYQSGILAKGTAETNLVAYQPADEAALEPVKRIEAICAEHGVAPGAAALQFSARDPRITATVIGVSRPERVDQTLDWLSADIPQACWDALMDLPYSTEDPEANRDYKPG